MVFTVFFYGSPGLHGPAGLPRDGAGTNRNGARLLRPRLRRPGHHGAAARDGGHRAGGSATLGSRGWIPVAGPIFGAFDDVFIKMS